MPGTEQTLIDLDARRMKAMTDGDVATLKAILADDLSYFHSSARVDTKKSLIEGMESGATSFDSIEPADVEARVYGSSGVVTGTARFRVSTQGRKLDFGVRFTDVWVQKDGDWRMVAWQSTKLPG
ncbi:MAG: nuclear transport factor 2 family protein [Chloroflexi bacterium]|nr:nuclear transport factor 2 family protein [Chloroflexota bacterium]